MRPKHAGTTAGALSQALSKPLLQGLSLGLLPLSTFSLNVPAFDRVSGAPWGIV